MLGILKCLEWCLYSVLISLCTGIKEVTVGGKKQDYAWRENQLSE